MINCIVNFSSNKALKSAHVFLLKVEGCRNFKYIFFISLKVFNSDNFLYFYLYQSINFSAFFIRQSAQKLLIIVFFFTKTTKLKFLKKFTNQRISISSNIYSKIHSFVWYSTQLFPTELNINISQYKL